MKFQVVEGSHCDLQGRVFKKGDVLESRYDLTKQFANKFKLVDVFTPVTKRPVTINDSRKVAQLLPDQPPPAPVAPPVVRQTVVKAQADEPEEEPGPVGVDVTASFPKAIEEDYKIFKNEGRYYIYDVEALNKPLNGDGVKKVDVDKAIEALAHASRTVKSLQV